MFGSSDQGVVARRIVEDRSIAAPAGRGVRVHAIKATRVVVEVCSAEESECGSSDQGVVAGRIVEDRSIIAPAGRRVRVHAIKAVDHVIERIAVQTCLLGSANQAIIARRIVQGGTVIVTAGHGIDIHLGKAASVAEKIISAEDDRLRSSDQDVVPGRVVEEGPVRAARRAIAVNAADVPDHVRKTFAHHGCHGRPGAKAIVSGPIVQASMVGTISRELHLLSVPDNQSVVGAVDSRPSRSHEGDVYTQTARHGHHVLASERADHDCVGCSTGQLVRRPVTGQEMQFATRHPGKQVVARCAFDPKLAVLQGKTARQDVHNVHVRLGPGQSTGRGGDRHPLIAVDQRVGNTRQRERRGRKSGGDFHGGRQQDLARIAAGQRYDQRFAGAATAGNRARQAGGFMDRVGGQGQRQSRTQHAIHLDVGRSHLDRLDHRRGQAAAAERYRVGCGAGRRGQQNLVAAGRHGRRRPATPGPRHGYRGGPNPLAGVVKVIPIGIVIQHTQNIDRVA